MDNSSSMYSDYSNDTRSRSLEKRVGELEKFNKEMACQMVIFSKKMLILNDNLNGVIDFLKKATEVDDDV